MGSLMPLNEAVLIRQKLEIPKLLFRIALIAFVILSLSGNLRAQNLIPNPGFEELFTQLDYQWIQPQGVFYHYEAIDSTHYKSTHSGRYVNGLCMYNTVPNEYLHVKLLEPLEAGQEYRLEVFAHLMRAKSSNAYEQELIGVYFGNENLDTHVPGDLFFEPQVSLELPDSNRFEWFQMVDTFTAGGGEQYLTMGYFPSTRLKEERDKAREAYMREIERRYKAGHTDPDEDKSWLYLPPDEQKEYLKKQKKKKRKRKKNKSENRGEVEFPMLSKAQKDWASQNEKIVFESDIPGVFAVRYYFDDLCLTEVDADSATTVCKPENLPEKIEAGRTINLRNVFFKTDSATLLEESKFQLGALYRIMRQHPTMQIEVRGYTDNRGDDAYNLALSRRRAAAVEAWLIGKGIDARCISAQGFGEDNPIQSNETEAGRARNRRVTFYIKSM